MREFNTHQVKDPSKQYHQRISAKESANGNCNNSLAESPLFNNQKDAKLMVEKYPVSREHPYNQWIDVRRTDKLPAYGWKRSRKNVLIIHGFNGTHSKTPMSFLRDAYLSRKDYNVFMVDWSPLTRFPCYLSALSNTKLAAQCTAQLYSHITQSGAVARKITCVGHSLGAHVCGMMSNHLTEKQYKIIDTSDAVTGQISLWDYTLTTRLKKFDFNKSIFTLT